MAHYLVKPYSYVWRDAMHSMGWRRDTFLSHMLCVHVSHPVWKNICRRWKKNKYTRVIIPPFPSAFISSVAWNCSGKRVCTSENGSGPWGYGARGMRIFHFTSSVKMFSLKVNIETARVGLQTWDFQMMLQPRKLGCTGVWVVCSQRKRGWQSLETTLGANS